MSKYIPVYEYTKKYNIQKQNVYRWIREGKISKDDFIIEEKIVKRIKIKEDLNPIKNRA